MKLLLFIDKDEFDYFLGKIKINIIQDVKKFLD